MEDKLHKYASLLLKCINLKDKKYLFISIPKFLNDFLEILKIEASKYDLEEVYIYEEDPFKKHELLLYLDDENINKHPLFNHDIFNKYAKLDAAFLFINSQVPDLMNDIDPEKLKLAREYTRSTEKYFRSLYETEKLNWCIGGVPNEYWAKRMNKTLLEMWDLIFNVCLIKDDKDPYKDWLDKLNNLDKKANILNDYHFKYLHYKNSLGTDIKVYLPERHLWVSANNGKFIANMPTEEVFTSPLYNKTEGIVYASKPLIYNNITIDDFWIKFSDGKVIDYDAKIGKDTLKTIIETDEYSCYLGECALVPFDSPISNTNELFCETLYDENASCHLALGMGFTECLDTNEEVSLDNLRDYGVNYSKQHVDFMIGTSDLSITGITHDDKVMEVFKDGNFVI